PVAVRSRGTDPQLGDRVRATAAGGGAHRGVWIYRNEAQLVVACPGPAHCERTETTVTAEITIAAIGSYQIVVLAANAPLPTPTGRFDVDAAAAEKANVTVSRQDLTVR
ncbi:MAG: hypothetical protein H7138_18140, partial [Myxococcales bacterium]|nr:hypothetical protein [Myxococcales bacterium]